MLKFVKSLNDSWQKGIIFSSTPKICFLNLNAIAYEVIHQIDHVLHRFSLEGKTVKSKVERNYYKNLLLWRQSGFENSTFYWFFHSCYRVLTFILCRSESTHPAKVLLSCFWMNITCKGKVKMEARSKSEHSRIIHFCFCFEDSSEKTGEKITGMKWQWNRGIYFITEWTTALSEQMNLRVKIRRKYNYKRSTQKGGPCPGMLEKSWRTGTTFSCFLLYPLFPASTALFDSA